MPFEVVERNGKKVKLYTLELSGEIAARAVATELVGYGVWFEMGPQPGYQFKVAVEETSKRHLATIVNEIPGLVVSEESI